MHDLLQKPEAPGKEAWDTLLSKAATIPYLLAREGKSNRGETNCLYHYLCQQPTDKCFTETPEDRISVPLKFTTVDSLSLAHPKADDDKGTVNIAIELV